MANRTYKQRLQVKVYLTPAIESFPYGQDFLVTTTRALRARRIAEAILRSELGSEVERRAKAYIDTIQAY